ncbi:GntR family transcriptional regulator [Psychrobacillus sp. Sa2BUA9]|uniref:GntR family transcriptional regulator n=1 Tax=Psychrobacillus faecigallinarum TaxID=2762235 RepID=A0ABR8R5V5_9BACI|nr:GntR family transcriptional regulator [Psychrobacillus faecigallinarum]MBD7943094.1 GntR family transcriptional regulator [Psychrobacillus faecigallinarum]
MKKLFPKESLADQAFKALKDAIITGKLPQQEELPEEKLAVDLGISRTPIREAIKRLAVEGLVQLNKSKPATVATFKKEDGLHYMEIRRLLEIYNIDKHAHQISEEILCALEDNLVEQLASIKNESYNTFIDLDQQFHLLIGSIGANRKLSELINEANAGSNRAFLILSNTLEVSAEEAYYEHEEILKALRIHHNDLAKQLMTRHLDNVERRFLSYFNEEDKK